VQSELKMSRKQFAVMLAVSTVLVVWALSCPSMHPQSLPMPTASSPLLRRVDPPSPPPTPPIVELSSPIRLEDSPFLRHRAMGVTLYCLMLFDRTGATGVQMHDERLVSTFLIDWQPIGVQMIHEHVTGCGCRFQIITPLPWWLTQGDHYLAWKVELVDRKTGQYFILTMEKVLGWYVEPWR